MVRSLLFIIVFSTGSSKPTGENIPDDLHNAVDHRLNHISDCRIAAGTGTPPQSFDCDIRIHRNSVARLIGLGIDFPALEGSSSGGNKAASGEGIFRSHIHAYCFHCSSAAVCLEGHSSRNIGDQGCVTVIRKGNGAHAAYQETNKKNRNDALQ